MQDQYTSIWSFLLRHIFVLSTGFAALLHSTWSLATLFNGLEPQQGTQAWWAWAIPAFAIAFSIDAGQIAISVELRSGERTRWKYIAFCILASATYFLQWMYLIAHVPLIQLGTGVALQHATLVSAIRDFAIWIVPGLLPISTVLYTFGYAPVRRAKVATKPMQAPTNGVQPTISQAPIANANADAIVAPTPPLALLESPNPSASAVAFPIACPDCNWHGSYATQRSATNALTAHRRQCAVSSANGHRQE